MANVAPQTIRNVVLIGHGGSGKTSLAEAMLFTAGAVDRMGSIQDGTTVMDFEPEEIARKATIGTSVAFCDWKGSRLNLIDTPGFINFIEEAHAGMRAADGAVMVAGGVHGIKAEAEKLYEFVAEFDLPMIVFVGEMEKDLADFEKALEEIERSFRKEAIPLQLPIGAGASFEGLVDLIEMKAYIHENGKAGVSEIEIPSGMSAQIEKYRKKLIEKIVESDDNLLSIYLDGGEIDKVDIINGVKIGSITRQFIPVTAGSAVKNIGADMLMDAIVLCLPSPEERAKVSPAEGKNPKTGETETRLPDRASPFSAYVFKTIADPFTGRLSIFRVYSGTISSDSNVFNAATGTKERVGQVFHLFGKKHTPVQGLGPGEIGVVAKLKDTNTGDTLSDEAHPLLFAKVRTAEPIISYAIESKSKGDEEKISSGLHKILEEDPALQFHRDEETKEMIISGMGQLHLEVALEKLKRKFGADVQMKTPKIPYRETITATAKVQGRYKKQSGGRGQYGDCWIEVKPRPRGQGFEFIDAIVGGSIPRNYIPAVEKGIVETLREGIIAGYPMIDLSITLFDGSYHPVDSSEMAFKIAGSMAIKKAATEARPVMLEPIMKVNITVPEETLGAVIGDLNAKRGKVQGMEQSGACQKITALVPMAEMLTYANQLQSLTAGRGLYTMQFSHYEQVPGHLTQKIVAESEAKKKKED
ncbi:MAG: elongation factor G [Nitrospiraceae bacterium]|nr:elongation factor G [Nitrospiraceae bacterium]